MIREATAEDLPALLAIQGATLAEPWPEFLRASTDGPPLVLVHDGQRSGDATPVGYALVVRADDTAYVVELAVAPPAQSEGHGSQLLEVLLDTVARDGVATVQLTARADDNRLQSFYGQFGFAVRDRLPDNYEDGDGVLLEAQLTGDHVGSVSGDG